MIPTVNCRYVGVGVPRIQGLPPELETVPAQRDEWRKWRDQVHAYRLAIRDEAEHDPEVQALEWAKCRDSCAYWMAIYTDVFEPRKRRVRTGWQPAIPFAFQVDLIDWFYERYADDEIAPDGAVSKARTMAVSWTFCFITVHGWQFIEPCEPLLISRKEESVDSKRRSALFTKIRHIIDRQPRWLQPKGFDWDKHHQRLLIENPENGNQIFGESTTGKAGRGDRASWALVDEFAFVDDGDTVWSNLQQTTDHRFVVSTENFDHGDHHWRLWNTLKETVPQSVREVDWWLHPYYDDEWYEFEKKRAEDDGKLPEFHREVDRNPFVGHGTWIYPTTRTRTTGDFPYDPLLGKVYCTIDPGTDAETGIVWLQHDPVVGHYRVVDAYMTKDPTADYFATILAGDPDYEQYTYDHDAEELMEWTATLKHVVYVGDPFGKTRGADGQTFYDKLKKRDIRVRSSSKNKARYHPGRQSSLKDLLPKIDFHDSPRARRVLKALQEYRTAPRKGNSTIEAPKPVHNQHSHLATAMEFFAVNLAELRSLDSMNLAPWDPATAKPATHLWRVA